jgi:hypothetical protein
MRSKFGSFVLVAALAGWATLCGPASALVVVGPTYTYDLYLSDNFGDFVNLDLTTHQLAGPLPSGGALVTNITGNANINGTAYIASGPTSFNGADNLLYSTSPFVDSHGISFDLTSILVSADPPYNNYSGGLTCNGGVTGCPTFSPTNMQLSQTPLPAALPLFATGLGVMGLFGWRRKRKAAAVAT